VTAEVDLSCDTECAVEDRERSEKRSAFFDSEQYRDSFEASLHRRLEFLCTSRREDAFIEEESMGVDYEASKVEEGTLAIGSSNTREFTWLKNRGARNAKFARR
jgi:hypothetical protein